MQRVQEGEREGGGRGEGDVRDGGMGEGEERGRGAGVTYLLGTYIRTH